MNNIGSDRRWMGTTTTTVASWARACTGRKRQEASELSLLLLLLLLFCRGHVQLFVRDVDPVNPWFVRSGLLCWF